MTAPNACPNSHSGKHEPRLRSNGEEYCDHCDQDLPTPSPASEYFCRHCSLVRDVPAFADDPCSNGAPHDWCQRYKAGPSSSPALSGPEALVAALIGNTAHAELLALRELACLAGIVLDMWDDPEGESMVDEIDRMRTGYQAVLKLQADQFTRKADQ